MRGGFLHNQLLIAPVIQFCQEHGINAHEEYPTMRGRNAGFVDLFILHGELRIVCEAECSPDRVPNDVVKAQKLEATHLMILVPNASVAKGVERKLARFFSENTGIFFPIKVTTPGTVLKQLSELKSLKVHLECPRGL